MGERNLKLVADNKPRKRHILLLFACLAVVLGMGWVVVFVGVLLFGVVVGGWSLFQGCGWFCLCLIFCGFSVIIETSTNSRLSDIYANSS